MLFYLLGTSITDPTFSDWDLFNISSNQRTSIDNNLNHTQKIITITHRYTTATRHRQRRCFTEILRTVPPTEKQLLRTPAASTRTLLVQPT